MRGRLIAAFVIVVALPMLAAVAALPRAGAPDAPVHTHVGARYLAEGPHEAGAENIVTAVLLNYRGLDTFGEVVVIFAALAAALAVLLAAGGPGNAPTHGPGPRAPASNARVPPSPVVAFILRLVAPFIAMFGAFVILTGHETPGGGLQGAAILGGLVIVLAMVLGRGEAHRLLSGRSLPWLHAAGPMAFFGAGLLGALLTGFALGYPTEPGLHLVREFMIIGVEVGIGIGGAMIFATLFLTLEES